MWNDLLRKLRMSVGNKMSCTQVSWIVIIFCTNVYLAGREVLPQKHPRRFVLLKLYNNGVSSVSNQTNLCVYMYDVITRRQLNLVTQ